MAVTSLNLMDAFSSWEDLVDVVIARVGDCCQPADIMLAELHIGSSKGPGSSLATAEVVW
jgi:hypothetical protein